MIPLSLSFPRHIVRPVEVIGVARRKGQLAYLLSHPRSIHHGHSGVLADSDLKLRAPEIPIERIGFKF